MNPTVNALREIDDELSKRHLDLDPCGYFIIYLEREAGLICAKHFTNVINDRGLAVDPETGNVIPARGKVQRTESTLFSYLGREFVRAEDALVSGQEYVQD